MPIRVVIAEDNALLRDGLARLISSTTGLELVGTAGSYDELLALVAESNPDVVVTDIRMPPTGTDEGIRAAAALRSSHPDTGVIVLSQYVSPAYAMSLLSQGSERRGYLLKDRVADVDDLVDAIRVVAAGGAVIDPKVVEQLVASSSRKAKVPLDFLTPREREVLELIARGLSNREIAAALVVEESTIRTHVKRILMKLDLRDRVQAVMFAYETGVNRPAAGGERTPPRDGATS